MFYGHHQDLDVAHGVDWSPRPAGYRGKQIFDTLLVLAALPLLAPVIAVLWCLVKLDGGPGFFGHKRVGFGGRAFTCWKLRTMVPDAERRLQAELAANRALAQEWQRHQKLKNDPRVTRIGAFLRRSSLDELPQIWNVLMGDMSLVGPRPFTPDQLPLYVDAGGSSYFRVRPGITGPWQVYGRNATRFVERVQFDDTYSHGGTLFGDILLVAQTAKVVLKMTGQ
ncbi:MAG: sugar transferase [Rhodobacteraceae bacterium]|nr:sugar transferase [Paracoccaceae bacterium]